MRKFKSLLEYCNDLINSGDDYGEQLLNEFGQKYGCRVYIDEYKMLWTPDKLSYGTKKQIEWTCKSGHKWKTGINNRTSRKRNCPYCSRREAGKKNSKATKGVNDLATLYPDLLDEWDYDKNSKNGIHPENIKVRSTIKAHWICEKGHSWESTVYHRTYSNRGCPYCSGNLAIIGETDIGTTHPGLLREWNYELNDRDGIFPQEIKAGSNKSIHWKCSSGHQWQAKPNDRVNHSTGCPYCSTVGTSYPEQFIFWSFKQIFEGTQNRVKLFKSAEHPAGIEYDIYIPDLKLLIEYSGYFWHMGKEEIDLVKQRTAIVNGYRFLKIEENPDATESFSYPNFIISKGDNKSLINLIEQIIYHYSLTEGLDYIEIEKIAREYSRGKILEEKSLNHLYPDISSEWNYEENIGIAPYNITPGSRYIASWICSNNPKHKWKARIADRVIHNRSCPYCSNQKIMSGYNDLETTNPELAKEWDYTLNSKTPNEVSKGSSYKAHWVCSKNESHKWVATVNNRNAGQGCPYCAKENKVKKEEI